MILTLERAQAMTQERDRSMKAGDVDAYLELWADDLVDEAPFFCIEGKAQLRAAIEGALAASRVVEMVTRTRAVADDAVYYEFAMVWENRSTRERTLQTGMTYHEVDAAGRWCVCREYWDPADKPRRSSAELPEITEAWQAKQPE